MSLPMWVTQAELDGSYGYCEACGRDECSCRCEWCETCNRPASVCPCEGPQEELPQ